MSKVEKDKDRENRIDMEVVADACGSEERAMDWYDDVSDDCDFSFIARCINEKRKSPLNVNNEVEVLGTSPAEECEREIYVDIRWNDRKLAAPLSQIEAFEISEETKQVIEDWHYWVKRGYEF